MMQLKELIKNPKFAEGFYIRDLVDPEEIRALQTALTRSGRPIAIDGINGPQTETAWIDFKIDNHQRDPELVGSGSLNLLFNSIKKFDRLNTAAGIYYEITPIRACYLDLIAYAEGTDRNINAVNEGYNIKFGHSTFSDYSKFPYGIISANGYRSDASGRYQIMSYTWATIQRALNLPSFNPTHQDQAAMWLLHVKRNALKYVDADDLGNFLNICSYEWASLPPSRYGQPILTVEKLESLLLSIKRSRGLK